MGETAHKLQALRARLHETGGLVIAFSGGVDSSFLLAVAVQELGDRAVAATIAGPLNPPGEIEFARDLARELGATHHVIELNPLQDAQVTANTPERCYFCKQLVFTALKSLAQSLDLAHVAHGEHTGDAGDFRPGRRAAQELGIIAPLAEVGLNKAEIRELSFELGLKGWDRPSMACLASRIPYGEALDKQVLESLGKAEAALRGLGLTQVRVRHHGSVARVEILPSDFEQLADTQWRQQVVEIVQAAGYKYVTLDLTGFRSGSMNEVL